MGHKDLDLDAIGSALAMYYVANHFHKETYIILNDKEHESGVSKILNCVKKSVHFISSKEISQEKTSRSLLIIVDVNKPVIMQDSEIATQFKNIIILDHHDKNETTPQANIELIDDNASSTSQIVTEYLYYHGYPISSLYATFLLAGITLDTNDFSVKTDERTHYAAYYLIRNGASVQEVNVLLKQDIEEYILRQKVITDVEVLKHTIAFAKGNSRICYKKEELAKIADTLLEFNHIESSYVIGKISDNEIGISARSIGYVDVGEILAKLGGGGDTHDAAAVIRAKTIKEVETELKKVLGERK